jgi:ribokinase
MQLEIPLPTVLAYARAARSQGVRVVLNAAPAQALPAELLQLIDVLVVNQGELEVLAGGPGSLAECLSRIDVPCIVVTLGEQGSCARIGNSMRSQAAFEVNCIDSTGAGDTFCGVLVAALARGDEWQQALRQASAAGALACTRVGAQSSIPTQSEVNRFLA